MTTNQIAYWTLEEQKRHNLATEQVQKSSVDESKRHNQVSEAWTGVQISEMGRHNVADEAISSRRNDISYFGYETERMRIPLQQYANETARMGLAVQKYGYDLARLSASEANAINSRNADTNYLNMYANAITNAFNAQTHRNSQISNSEYQRVMGDAATRNALTNSFNAVTNRFKLWTDIVQGTSAEMRHWISDISNAAGNVAPIFGWGK